MSGKRHTAREMAVQMLYQRDMGGAELPQVFQTFDLGDYLARESAQDGKRRKGGRGTEAERAQRRIEESFAHARALVEGTDRHREQIDELIRGQADNWRLERMPVVDRNILRLAVYEMLHQPEVPKLVVVDEAIELAKKYGSDQSGRFVNGLLDGLLKQRAFPGSLS